MKASSKLASLIAVFALSPLVAVADPMEFEVSVFCPNVGNGFNSLAHFGDYIAGNGEELLGGQRRNVYFKSTESIASKIPAGFTNYKNKKATYDSTTGSVTCSYSTYLYDAPEFSVSYTLTNGKGGIVTHQTDERITFRLPIGFKA